MFGDPLLAHHSETGFTATPPLPEGEGCPGDEGRPNHNREGSGHSRSSLPSKCARQDRCEEMVGGLAWRLRRGLTGKDRCDAAPSLVELDERRLAWPSVPHPAGHRHTGVRKAQLRLDAAVPEQDRTGWTPRVLDARIGRVLRVPRPHFALEDLTELIPPHAGGFSHSLAALGGTRRPGQRFLPFGVQFLEKIVDKLVGQATPRWSWLTAILQANVVA